jgi:hypothetical protein
MITLYPSSLYQIHSLYSLDNAYEQCEGYFERKKKESVLFGPNTLTLNNTHPIINRGNFVFSSDFSWVFGPDGFVCVPDTKTMTIISKCGWKEVPQSKRLSEDIFTMEFERETQYIQRFLDNVIAEHKQELQVRSRKAFFPRLIAEAFTDGANFSTLDQLSNIKQCVPLGFIRSTDEPKDFHSKKVLRLMQSWPDFSYFPEGLYFFYVPDKPYGIIAFDLDMLLLALLLSRVYQKTMFGEVVLEVGLQSLLDDYGPIPVEQEGHIYLDDDSKNGEYLKHNRYTLSFYHKVRDHPGKGQIMNVPIANLNGITLGSPTIKPPAHYHDKVKAESHNLHHSITSLKY